MSDRPIIFSAPMVLAILAGRKSQTRRVLEPQPEHLQVYDWKGNRLHDSEYRHWCWKGHVGADNWDDITTQLRPALPYAVGDRLWVREAWAPVNNDGDRWIDYRATPRLPGSVKRAAGWDNAPDDPEALRWRSPIHMPRSASRFTLTVTDVRVQRLQDISAADSIAEGVECDTCRAMNHSACNGRGCFASLAEYRALWTRLHGPNSWDANPWVTATTFTAERRNIDGGAT